ncbi:hypothetical protein ERX46_02450 [Brumimicrobium glaciale]|uniref:Uncharacterized protein n=1 Tax=Brumimicrobium glaciale TaxID=200475 RepID=A0A4Q4KUS9_9FLAO|nr:hypothetical protein [Brumimicrobium glaciale]RYM35874.1 hypothetical protein ERX46_02450 [Brumimicrobium glaciale]
MNDKLIFSDGKTLYVTLESKVRNWVKWFLISINICLYSLPILLISITSKTNNPSVKIGAILFSVAIFWILTRPTLWNIFGRESVIITKENLSYYRDFGLYKTTIQNTKIKYGISVFIENELAYEDEPYIVITFCELSLDDEYNEILTTSIKTPEENFEVIKEHLNEIFEISQNNYEFSPN